MRVKFIQLDLSDTRPDALKRIETEMDKIAQELENSGFQIQSETIIPQQNNIRGILKIVYEKISKPQKTRYAYMIGDSRNGHDVLGKIVNAKLIELEKENDCLRSLTIPMKNDMYVQELLVYTPRLTKTAKELLKEAKE